MKSDVNAKFDEIDFLFWRNQQIWKIETHVNVESDLKVVSFDYWKM